MDKAKLELDGYEVVRGFLDPTLCKLLTHTVKLMAAKLDYKDLVASAPYTRDRDPIFRDGHWDGRLPGEDSQVPKSHAWYGDPLMDSILELSGPLIGQIINKQLFPTYSYCRLYHPGAILREHKDRPECQYSATIALGGDPWPIYMGQTHIDLAHGDMVLYKGCEIPHRRDTFGGKECIQLFLHYGDIDDPIGRHFDGRLELGLPPTIDSKAIGDLWHASEACTTTLKMAVENNSKQD